MRTLWLLTLFGLSALGAFALTRAIDDLVPDPPPPVEAIELYWSTPTSAIPSSPSIVTTVPDGEADGG